ncbi:MAG TPA: O-antigen ligase family protein, partial [Patescibacteria group bacterium]|nr:O-antigen ligase family protein [Patescibacteria group bacterium]
TILILSLVSILLTFSRSAYIMFFVGVLSLMSIKKQRKLFFLIVIFSVGIFLTSKMVFKSEGTNLLRTASGNARLDSIGNAVVIFKDNPIFGVGFNSYRYAQKRYGFINEDKRLIHSGAGTDNSFLFILATTGIVGFLGFLYLLYKIFNLANRMIKKNQYALILFVSILSLGVNSFFVNSLFFPSLMLWVWILAGLTEST